MHGEDKPFLTPSLWRNPTLRDALQNAIKLNPASNCALYFKRKFKYFDNGLR